VTGDIKYHTEQALAVNKQMLKAQLSGDRAMIEHVRDATHSAYSACDPTSLVFSAIFSVDSARSPRSALWAKYANKLLELIRECV